MDDSNQKPKCGRPQEKFTPLEIVKIEELARIGCSDEIIADCISKTKSVIQRYFKAKIAQKKAEFKAEIVQVQQDMLKKQPVMAIWLGKQHLGQTDVQKIEIASLPAITVALQGTPESGK